MSDVFVPVCVEIHNFLDDSGAISNLVNDTLAHAVLSGNGSPKALQKAIKAALVEFGCGDVDLRIRFNPLTGFSVRVKAGALA